MRKVKQGNMIGCAEEVDRQLEKKLAAWRLGVITARQEQTPIQRPWGGDKLQETGWLVYLEPIENGSKWRRGRQEPDHFAFWSPKCLNAMMRWISIQHPDIPLRKCSMPRNEEWGQLTALSRQKALLPEDTPPLRAEHIGDWVSGDINAPSFWPGPGQLWVQQYSFQSSLMGWPKLYWACITVDFFLCPILLPLLSSQRCETLINISDPKLGLHMCGKTQPVTNGKPRILAKDFKQRIPMVWFPF